MQSRNGLANDAELAPVWHHGTMQFLIGRDIGHSVTGALRTAERVRVASAFFSPGSSTLSELRATKSLTLIISEEFTVNNPKNLEQLTSAVVRSIPTDSKDGKLHAKVFIFEMPDGSDWVMVGSSNLTDQGLFFNQEACVALTSKEASDVAAITDIKLWFVALLKKSRSIDIAEAKAIWKARGRQKLTTVTKSEQAAPAYFVLKSTEGSGPDAPRHWPMFESERVIAIGWEAVAVDPSIVNDEELWDAVDAAYPDFKPGSKDFAVRTIRDFVNIPIGSIVMVSHGYASNASDDNLVHIYAFARVDGAITPTPLVAGEWRFRRSATLQIVDATLTVGVMRKLLGAGSLMQTLHSLSQNAIEAVADELGIHIDV
jgi:HKD family nuclease